MHLSACFFCHQKSSSNLPSSVKKDQTLTFRDKKTGVLVKLVGTMHYNPHSIGIASKVTREALENETLGALVLESCEKRWKKTIEFQPPGSITRALLDNEFQACQELCRERDVYLGDQNIDDLSSDLKELFVQTMKDCFTNPSSIKADFKKFTESELVPLQSFGSDGRVVSLSFEDFLDYRLLACMPISMLRYPLAWLLKSPKLVVPVVTFYLTLASLPGIVEATQFKEQIAGNGFAVSDGGFDDVLSFLFLVLDALQIVVLSRLMLVALLGKRNDILSQSIRDKCEEIKGTDMSVIAILGAAHLNGVQNRLLSFDDDVL